MGTVKQPVVVCDICGDTWVKGADYGPKEIDLEVYGLTLRSGFYAGPGGGGPTGTDLFVCESCIRGDAATPPLTLVDLISVLVFEQDIAEIRYEEAERVARAIAAAKQEVRDASVQ